VKVDDVHDLIGAPISRLVDLIRDGEVSAHSLMSGHLSHVAVENPKLNAIVTVSPSALADAAEVDKAIDRGEDPGPLAGIPFTVKDTIATAGLRTTAGSRLLENCVPLESAPAVRRMQRAGAILLGKTNTPEFALDLHTDNEIFGPTVNPRDSTLTPGGSSGGESAAVASGCSVVGLGTDFGSSLRWPAQCTGVAGLRPSVGRVPGSGALPYFTASGITTPDPDSFFAQTQVIGPIARNVEDLWLALVTISGQHLSDPMTKSAPLPDPSAVNLSTLKCAWFASDGTYAASDEVGDVLTQAADVLAYRGVSVSRRRPRAIESADRVYNVLRAADNATWMSRLPSDVDGRRPAAIEAAIDKSREISAAEIQASLLERQALRADLSRFMLEYPILLTAVSRSPSFEVTAVGNEAPRAPDADIVSPCRGIGLFGLPAVSIPFGRSETGAFISVQVVGRSFAEHQVIAVATLLQRHCREHR
jgi:Asp-tRNA(Asn)/Glu-tRNA(Gln) amidotransferase A subunit family amidase